MKVKTIYNMQNSELMMFVSTLTMFMKQDAAYFAIRGVSMADILALEALGNAFEVLSQDGFYAAEVFMAVQEKDNERKTGLRIAREIAGYFVQEYGGDSVEYKRLSVGKFAVSNDNAFVSLMRDVVRIAEEKLAELSAIGLTQAKIDELAASADSLELKVDAVADAKAERKRKTAERISNGNEIYSIASKYAAIGKMLAEEHPQVNYKTYLIKRYKKTRRKKKDPEPEDEE